MPRPSPPTETGGLQPYTLRWPHLHGGQIYPAGTVLHLRPSQIERVQAAEAAAGVSPPASAPATQRQSVEAANERT